MTGSAIEVVCERIKTLPAWRRTFATKTRRGDLLLMYLNEEESGFSYAEIARHFDLIEEAEALLDKERAAVG